MEREIEVIGGNLHQLQFLHHKAHSMLPRIQPGPPRWETGDRLPEEQGQVLNISLWRSVENTSVEYGMVTRLPISSYVKCKTGGFHGGDYEEFHLLVCYAELLL
jgi:hypothetical protein